MLLFNLCGYRLVFDYLQQQHHLNFTAQLDKDEYADEDLISIKTALSLPYYTASMDFERIDGSIRIDGVEYNYVKRRIINDSLELLCLPNEGKQKLQSAKSDFFKLSNDLQQEKNKKGATIIKNVLLEYCNVLTTFTLEKLQLAKQKHAISTTSFLNSLYALVHEQPPETMRFTA